MKTTTTKRANTKRKQPGASTGGAAEPVAPKYELIKLGIDWHAEKLVVCRMIENATPEPPQKFTHQAFLAWIPKQLGLAKQVVSCYEAGAGGFVLHRALTPLGVTNYVVVPKKLESQGNGVQDDKSDSLGLVLNLDRYVLGNKKALATVYVPTVEEELLRHQGRQRQQLRGTVQSLASMGRSVLLLHGYRLKNSWWRPNNWRHLQVRLQPQPLLLASLHAYREVIVVAQGQMEALSQQLKQTAPKERPVGFGALTLTLILRELCTPKRFKRAKQIGSYSGLVGGVSATGDQRQDLPITKVGNPHLRVLLIELAWRLVMYQSQCRLVQKWRHILLNPKAHARQRKRAIVAVARQLLVDLWRWQLGQVTPAQLGWILKPPQTQD